MRITRSATFPLDEDYPEPTPEMLNGDVLFDAIWRAIKGWDLQRAPGQGYSGATGNDVRRIYDAIKSIDGLIYQDIAQRYWNAINHSGRTENGNVQSAPDEVPGSEGD